MDPDLANVLKILVPALGAWGAAWLTNRRERQQWLAKQEETQERQLAKQQDQIAAGWSEMTTQARAIINDLQRETIEAKTRAAMAEEKALKLDRDWSMREAKISERALALERELAELQTKYDMARAEIETLKAQRPPRRREAPEPRKEPKE